jgi:hypothetical protein
MGVRRCPTLYTARPMARLPQWSSPPVAPYVAGAAAAIAHLPALGHRLLRDDISSIRDNVELRTLSGLWHGLKRAADLNDSDPGASPVVRPLSAAFEWLAWQLVRAQPTVQHAVSIALHALAAVLLVRVLLAWKIRVRIALATAVLFAVHPASAAAVAAISSRALLLGGVVLLFAMLRAIEAKTARAHAAWLAIGVIGSACAHEAYFFSPLVLLLLARRPHRLAAVIAIVPAAIVASMILGSPGPFWSASLRTAAGILLHALFVTVVPLEGSSYFTPSEPSLPLAVAVLFAPPVLAIVLTRRLESLAPVRAALALVALAALSFAKAAIYGGVASDRSAWIVILGLALAGAALAEQLREQVAALSRILAIAPFAVALALVPLTWAHVVAFRDDTAVLDALAVDRPDDPEGKLAAALLLSMQERHEEALPICMEYRASRSLSTRAHLCIGIARLAGGDPGGAADALRHYVDRHPHEERGRRALIAALLATDQLVELRQWVVRWRTAYGKLPDVEAARAELGRRGAW